MYIYIYIYICVCVCVCVCIYQWNLNLIWDVSHFSVFVKKLVGNVVNMLPCRVKCTIFNGLLGGGRACSRLWGRWRTSSLEGCDNNLSGRAVRALCDAKRTRNAGNSVVHSGNASKLLLRAKPKKYKFLK